MQENKITDSCLLLGNGINRCCGGLSWEELLNKIARNYFTSIDTGYSNTLAFEQLKCTILSRNIKLQSNDFAYDVIAELDRISQDKYDEIFEFYKNIGFSNILTTNFDYSIERSLVSDYQYDKYTRYVIPQETKCSRIRHLIINDINIFHIHGELGKTGTICLGNVHYAMNLKAIMDSVLNYSKETDAYTLKPSIFEDDNLISWAQLFFTKDIFIVGLGLYDCDMDLWWLIAYRKQLILNGDKRIKNKITYYYLYEEKNQQFLDCLESMDVEVQQREVQENDWKTNYIDIAKNIKNLVEGGK